MKCRSLRVTVFSSTREGGMWWPTSVHICNPSAQEAGAGGSAWIQGQSGFRIKIDLKDKTTRHSTWTTWAYTFNYSSSVYQGVKTRSNWLSGYHLSFWIQCTAHFHSWFLQEWKADPVCVLRYLNPMRLLTKNSHWCLDGFLCSERQLFTDGRVREEQVLTVTSSFSPGGKGKH